MIHSSAMRMPNIPTVYIDCKNSGQPQKLGLFANADKNAFYVQNKYATKLIRKYHNPLPVFVYHSKVWMHLNNVRQRKAIIKNEIDIKSKTCWQNSLTTETVWIWSVKFVCTIHIAILLALSSRFKSNHSIINCFVTTCTLHSHC